MDPFSDIPLDLPTPQPPAGVVSYPASPSVPGGPAPVAQMPASAFGYQAAPAANGAAPQDIIAAVKPSVLLILAGSLVTSHDAGLSVPDWPTSYGWNMFTFPPSMWVANILYEHGHRLIASSVTDRTAGPRRTTDELQASYEQHRSGPRHP